MCEGDKGGVIKSMNRGLFEDGESLHEGISNIEFGYNKIRRPILSDLLIEEVQ